MRGPLAEFSEILVSALTGAELAESAVQKGWDLRSESGDTTQVRYLANPSGEWVNGHEVRFTPGVDRYVLVIYESLDPVGVVIFDGRSLAEVCTRLGKRHPNQETTLQLTPRNLRQLRDESEFVAGLQVHVYPGN